MATERGLALFGVLEQADPALVDPGVTARLELLLDEVLVGRQEMLGAIDAVCAQARHSIGRLTEAAPAQAHAVPPLTDTVAATAAGAADATQAGARGRGRGKRGRKAGSTMPRKGSAPKTSPKRFRAEAEPVAQASGETETGTRLRIPFGNKDAAQGLGARYRAGGWYAPPGVALAPFRQRGWL